MDAFRMKYSASITAVLLLCLSTFALGGPNETPQAKKVKLKGHMVDIACSNEQKDDPEYMRTKHSKKCFQMPACVKSGYAILTSDDKVIKFDANGNDLAQRLIASTRKENDFRIVVRGKLSGEELQVNKLELEK